MNVMVECFGQVRSNALLEVGGSPTWTLTEDYALGMQLKKYGWHCRYVQEYLAIGEAPDQIRNCYQQRSRWCKVCSFLLRINSWSSLHSWKRPGRVFEEPLLEPVVLSFIKSSSSSSIRGICLGGCMTAYICVCAGSLPNHVQLDALPAAPVQAQLAHAHHVQLWSVVLHRGRHLHTHLHHHPRCHHLVWSVPHRGLPLDCPGRHCLLLRHKHGGFKDMRVALPYWHACVHVVVSSHMRFTTSWADSIADS